MSKIIFTNGCFDILHKGHIELLKRAKQLGDKLIVGLNSDQSVKRLKGLTRPINDQQTRKQALLATNLIDEVLIFEEDTPYQLIKKINPSIIIKGGDYQASDVVGNDICQVVIFPIVGNYSTTNILRGEDDGL